MKPVIAIALLTLTACSANIDMQGVNPTDYYAAHPIKNAVTQHNTSYLVHFAPGEARLATDEIERLRVALHRASPEATRGIQLQFAEHDRLGASRQKYLGKLLRSMGFPTDNLLAEPSDSLSRNEAQIAITFDVVVLPDCPDWKMSPVTSYSNTHQGNFACANEVNTGLMVADPHDLIRGTGNVPTDTQRAAQTVNDYRAGKDFTPSSTTSPSATAAASGVSGAGQ